MNIISLLYTYYIAIRPLNQYEAWDYTLFILLCMYILVKISGHCLFLSLPMILDSMHKPNFSIRASSIMIYIASVAALCEHYL